VTDREEEILKALCSKVRYFSLEQIARTWWSVQPREIRRTKTRLMHLVGKSWLNYTTVLARPLLGLEAAVIDWHPHNSTPDFSVISRTLQLRWKKPVHKIEVFLAGPRSAAIFGGNVLGVVSNLCQTTHDLHVSELFLRYRSIDPQRASRWIGEHALSRDRKHSKRPDAVIRDEQGEVERAVEFGGAYKPDRVRAFHQDWRTVPYTLW
jgi:hypothetical protein